MVEILFEGNISLIGLFAERKINFQKLISKLFLSQENSKGMSVLIIDTNHRWNSAYLDGRSYVIQPKTRKEFLNILQSLSDYIHPRLKLIFIDDLPVYFRDYYSGIGFQNQNMRAYGMSLSLLRKHSQNIPILFRTYVNGFNEKEPIMTNHSLYYSDLLFKIVSENDKYCFLELPDLQIVHEFDL